MDFWSVFWLVLGMFILGVFVGSNLGVLLMCMLRLTSSSDRDAALRGLVTATDNLDLGVHDPLVAEALQRARQNAREVAQ